MWTFFILEAKEKKKTFYCLIMAAMLVTQAFKGKCIFLQFLQQMTDILFMFQLDIRQNMKFVFLFLERFSFEKNKQKAVDCEIWLHFHTDNLSFNLTELLFIILVITCCSRTFLPHFLAEIFFFLNKHATFISLFLLAVPMYNYFMCILYLFCEGLFLCSKGNNGRICKDRLEKKCSLAFLF